MKKAIVSVIGKDKKGIIAGVTDILFKMDINVADITQTIMQDYFTMIMLVELADSVDFSLVKESLAKKGEELGVTVSIQHEDIFNAMHRI
ncbi:MAG: ACT domain-containing protein [Clostridia bacterium]|nr:ACT domain-containing protein [Clostridia bacterium]